MGQNISALITNKKASYSKDLVHFYEEDAIIIPLNVESHIVRFLIEFASRYNNITDCINYLKALSFDENTTELNGLYGNEEYQYVLTLIDVIEKYQLESFSLTYYSEWADVPDDCYYMAVIENKIMKDSLNVSYSDVVTGLYVDGAEEKYNKMLGCYSYWVANESRYYSYDDAFEDYSSK